MRGFKTNFTSVVSGSFNALGVPALLLFSAKTGFGSLSQEMGMNLWISVLSTVLIWGLPVQVVHVKLYGLGTSGQKYGKFFKKSLKPSKSI